MAMAVASSLSRTLVTSALPHCASSRISQAPRAHPSGALFSRSASSFCGGSLLKSRVGGRREAGRRGRGRGGERFNNRTQLIRAAALSQSVDAYRRVGAPGGDNVDVKRLVQALEEASAKGREVVMAAVDKPRSIDYKGATDLVTDTDRKSEEAILAVVRKYFPDHLILGEEGGVSGDPTSEYLWCIDPLDGTTNFAQNYPSFAVSIAVLHKGRPIAAAVVEFAGGPFIWDTRTFTASSAMGQAHCSVAFHDHMMVCRLLGGGAFCNGRQIHVSIRDQLEVPRAAILALCSASTDPPVARTLLISTFSPLYWGGKTWHKVERSLFVTGFGYEHDAAWATNIDLFKEFTDKSRGVRRLGAAAVDMCHVALGIVEGYWEYRLKPWDMAAGVLIVEEAGGKVTRMDGGDFCVFERSVLVSNGTLHNKLVERISPPTQKLIKDGFDFSQWYKPSGYISEV